MQHTPAQGHGPLHQVHERRDHVRKEHRKNQHQDDASQAMGHPDAGAHGRHEEQVAQERAALRQRHVGRLGGL